ncbi:MAG: hypothetical protein K0R69_2099 [Clostridia bacterium]|nr:hypothetical protein [Clostridia bacterium]
MKFNYKILTGMAIGVVSIGSLNVFAANIAIISDKSAILTKQNAETMVLKTGDRIKIILDEDFQKSDIAQVDMNGTYGYINKNDIQVKEVQTNILVNGANLRQEPDPQAEIIKKLNVGTKVTATYKYVDWYAVELEDGKTGFIYKDQINEDNLYLVDRKSAQPLNTLLAKSAPVEVITWSVASGILPRGGTATIQDVYTGKSFNIKRTFGTNHADVEALTMADTAIMKEIWGGFTWERRPVIVHINGRRLAASMAGMPHAGKDSAPNLSYTSGLSGGYGYGQNLDAVKGNGMSGVCDLHFVGSRKHKDGNISATSDPLHQAAIKVAAKYK